MNKVELVASLDCDKTHGEVRPEVEGHMPASADLSLANSAKDNMINVSIRNSTSTATKLEKI